MPKGARTFLAIAVVWLGLWAMGSALLFQGARSHDGRGPQWAMPATGIVRGADVRFEGVVDGRDPVRAPLSQRPCAGALIRVYYGTWYYDSLHKREQHAARIATQGFAELPARLAVPAADVASARASARGDFTQFSADEWLLTGGQRVFVVGHVEARGGRLVLAPHRGLRRVDLHRGSQAEGVRNLSGEIVRAPHRGRDLRRARSAAAPGLRDRPAAQPTRRALTAPGRAPGFRQRRARSRRG